MLDFSFASLKIPWLREVATMAPCSQLVAKTKKTPFYGPLTSGFAVHCVYSGLPISHGNRPNVPKPTRKNNFRRVQLPSAPPKLTQNRRFRPSVLLLPMINYNFSEITILRCSNLQPLTGPRLVKFAKRLLKNEVKLRWSVWPQWIHGLCRLWKQTSPRRIP